MNNKEKPNCLVCERPAVIRGLCKSHYEIFRRSRKLAKDPTEYELQAIARKLISPDDKRVAKNPFEDLRLEMDKAAEKPETYKKRGKNE